MQQFSGIGFRVPEESGETVSTQGKAPVQTAPVRSLAKVLFRDGRCFTYYNDKFCLNEGALVFVSGKLAGKPGYVTQVTTKFKINLADYERILACPDMTIHGEYRRWKDKMICPDENAVSPEQFRSWSIAPACPEAEIVIGEGYELVLADLEKCDEISDAVFSRAINYLNEGRVRYLAVRGEQVNAFVEGTTFYEVSFRLKNGTVSELYCDCPFPGLCKHAVAVMSTLRKLTEEFSEAELRCFTAFDANYFWSTLARTSSTIRL